MQESLPRPADIDLRVGQRIRQRRIMLGLTQQDVADHLGITYQQAHKYERALNRVSAGRLYQFARVLQADPSEFFAPTETTIPIAPADRDRMLVALGRNFRRIADDQIQTCLAQLTRAIADSEG
jgi:transcriptional regulator with XRE-family HTH domain